MLRSPLVTRTPVQFHVSNPPVSAKSPVAYEQIWLSPFFPVQPKLLLSEDKFVDQGSPVGALSVPVSKSLLPILKATLLISGYFAFLVSMLSVTLQRLPMQAAVNL